MPEFSLFSWKVGLGLSDAYAGRQAKRRIAPQSRTNVFSRWVAIAATSSRSPYREKHLMVSVHTPPKPENDDGTADECGWIARRDSFRNPFRVPRSGFPRLPRQPRRANPTLAFHTPPTNVRTFFSNAESAETPAAARKRLRKIPFGLHNRHRPHRRLPRRRVAPCHCTAAARDFAALPNGPKAGRMGQCAERALLLGAEGGSRTDQETDGGGAMARFGAWVRTNCGQMGRAERWWSA